MNRFVMGLAAAATAGGLAWVLISALGGDARVPPDIAGRPNPVLWSAAAEASARESYRGRCLQCHGESGKGDGPSATGQSEPPPDLTRPETLAKKTDGEIFWAITKGRRPAMPGFESKIPEEGRWGLVHLVRLMSGFAPAPRP